MNLLTQIRHEARHHWVNSSLAVLGIAVTVAFSVAFFTAGTAAQRETARLMRDIGYNLRIVPKQTDPEKFWSVGYSAHTMAADGAQRFADQGQISYNHLLAMLSRRIDWRGGSVVLTGIAQEVTPKGKRQGSMLFEVEPGTVHLGAGPARRLDLAVGELVEIRGRELRIVQCLARTGSFDDVRVWVHLSDAQQILGEPERINEIQALECYCKDPRLDNLPELRAELQQLLPDATVFRREAMATARKQQRRVAERYFALGIPVVLLGCALWIACLAIQNVSQRRQEIGVLRALGHG